MSKKDIKKMQEQLRKLQAQLKETETAFHTEIGKPQNPSPVRLPRIAHMYVENK